MTRCELTTFKIAIVGEAWGAEEATYGMPFVGPAGQELNRMLDDAGLSRSQCFTTNVFNLRPEGDDIASLCCTKTSNQGIPGKIAIATGKYVQARYAKELERLYSELRSVQPNLCVLLGNTAAWALLDQTSVGKIRGAITTSPVVAGLKCLPTYHPAAVQRQYELRHITVMDFMKAKRECEFPEVRRVEREIWLDPTLQDISDFYYQYVAKAEELSFDIETSGKEITCIGFAPTVDRAIVIPIHDHRQPSGSYWLSLEDELAAWSWVRTYLSSPSRKVAQNGIYDMSHLWFTYGVPTINYSDDTMIRHHAMQPESTKGLDFLGSVYTNNPAWKTERPRGKAAWHSIKRED